MELAESNNWYAFLRLSPGAREDEIQSAVERLSRQASALAVTAPERSQSLRETVRAIKRDLLSGPENRWRYDASHPPRLPSPPAPPAPVPPEPVPYGFQGAGSRLARFLRTGWTCSACGNGGVPSDKFCTKCGAPIQPIRPEASGSQHAPRPRPACATCAYPLGPTDAFCSRCGRRALLAIDNNGNAAIMTNGDWSAGSTPTTATGISRPAVGYCVAVDNSGGALLYQNGSWSKPAKIDGNNNFGGISCVAVNTCTATDQYDNVTYYTPASSG